MKWWIAYLMFCSQWIRMLLIPSALDDQTPDADHPHRRRFTTEYLRKLKIVRNLWLCTLLSWLIAPIAPYVIVSGLFSTFLAFAVLDET